jgi:hypothetical protein
VTRFSADWLLLREAADRAARDETLGRSFAAALPPRPVIVDLGAGLGANARALAPLVAGDQQWLLAENDPGLRVGQRGAIAAWATRAGLPVRDEGDDVIVTAGAALWRFTPVALDLADDRALDEIACEAIACSALLDLASSDWLARLADHAARRLLPFLAALTVDGGRHWSPADPFDPIVAATFRADQARDKGLGPALGPDAAGTMGRLFAQRGYDVTTAPSDWRIGAGERDLLAALVSGDAAAARAALPEASTTIEAWERRRLAAAAAGRLGAVIGHRCLLALPADPRQTGSGTGGEAWPARCGTAR